MLGIWECASGSVESIFVCMRACVFVRKCVCVHVCVCVCVCATVQCGMDLWLVCLPSRRATTTGLFLSAHLFSSPDISSTHHTKTTSAPQSRAAGGENELGALGGADQREGECIHDDRGRYKDEGWMLERC